MVATWVKMNSETLVINMSMAEMLQKAFRDFVITDMNHPIAREMQGDNTSGTTTL